MAEIRRDALTGDWVILAPERAARPDEFVRSRASDGAPDFDATCPFCPGHESRTPAASLELPRVEGGWSIRAFANRYPVLSPFATGISPPDDDGLFTHAPASGAHEVIVETPIHNSFPQLRDQGELASLVQAYRERSAALMALPGIAYVLIFKNHGEGAGTSLVHPHSQVIATPVLPPREERTVRCAREHWRTTGRCLFCDLVEQELNRGSRVAFATERFAVIQPFAAAHPGETWIVPRAHEGPFVSISEDDVAEFASVLSSTLRAVAACFADPDYNYALHQEPPDPDARRMQHWYLQIIPRLKDVAGFELGSGMAINTLPPELAATRLRAHFHPRD